MESIVKALRADYPHLKFTPGPVAYWSPSTCQVIYKAGGTPVAIWTLLHELGHALLGHTSYESDAALLQKEVAAWHKAAQIAGRYGVAIGDDHIQSCLDTYRDWLHKRSTCPVCDSHGIQPSQGLYQCLNCKNTWGVTSARFCRPYRLRNKLSA